MYFYEILQKAYWKNVLNMTFNANEAVKQVADNLIK
jgi:hypothetical protein